MRFKQPNIIKFLKNSMGSTGVTPPGCSSGEMINDKGNSPYAFNISDTVKQNQNYRTALWTSPRLQLTAMNIPRGSSIGLEMHDDIDQFLRIESGIGEVVMGRDPNKMDYKESLDSRYAVLVPAGTYHNIINTGASPLKLYSVYAPKKHPFGTIDKTKEESDMRETAAEERQNQTKR